MSLTRRAFLQSAATAPPRRPNFLFLLPDQHRFDWISGFEGIPVETPNLDAIAARGVRFSHAVVASPLCAPSRACLAAGKEYDQCRVRNNGDDYPLDQKTYYSLLREAGYHVAACGKLDLHKATLDWGLDGKRLLKEWGFSDGVDNEGKGDAIASGAVSPKGPYMAYLHARGLAAAHVEDFQRRSKQGYAATWSTPLPEDAYCDNWIAENGLALLRAIPAGRPWHLVVNFTGPHNPMDITFRMDKLRRQRRYRQPDAPGRYEPEVHNTIRQNYTLMVENIDRLCGLLLDEVRRRGEMENTIVVFSSDHGEMLGDHNRWGKSVPFEPSVRVPLVIGGPGIQAGRKSDALVSLIDVGATFLDFAGLPVPKDMAARSLRPLLEGKSARHRDYVTSGLNSWRMVSNGRYKLITGFGEKTGGPPLLFDLESDPFENRDLSASSPRLVKTLSELIPKA